VSNVPRHLRSRTLGFTLLELVATTVIVGILSAAVIPRFFSEQDFEQRGYVDEVASSLRYAQRIAIASGCEVSFTLDAAGYTARQRSSLANCRTNTGPWNTQVQRADGTALNGTVPAGVSLTPFATVIFRADGSISAPPPSFTVGPFTLSIDRYSGTITVSP
jgi:MSHA pilin protein MshC